MTCVAENHVNIVVFAFKSHKRLAIAVDVKALDIMATDVNANAQALKKA